MCGYLFMKTNDGLKPNFQTQCTTFEILLRTELIVKM